ncbi:dephospho-CoA kinase [Pseudohongiella sp.]|uniref:Dephospho-CoA kinase n=1 Tax=marine sediment metagenome TaxID=412755 RepID=A0A0F9Y0S3_9ZZZZ|nr:dephospho-CoA kinase [Pseudohongiella sp.]HDZ10403.1 dephospho-CoA kinase [Pseudohongiella sp.]HEA61974.1 dephospho-CoA kinase [Pseudohongiella sp.]
MHTRQPLIIGVTGGIGSGKTAATDAFAALGITVVDADLVSRDVVQPGQPALAAIAEHFGRTILLAEGNLNRKALREIIFREPAAKQWLEALLHPLIRQAIISRLQQSDSAYTLLSSPLLLETDQQTLCSRVLVIDAPESLQLERTVVRDNSSPDTIKAIMASQFSRQQRLDKADDIIVNDGDLLALHNAVQTLHKTYLDMSKTDSHE